MNNKLGDYRRAYCKKTFQNQSLEQMCRALGAYPFKCRVQYNASFRSQDHVGGGYFSDYCLAKLVLLHDQIMNGKGQRGFLIYCKEEDAVRTGLEGFFKEDVDSIRSASPANNDDIEESFFESLMDTNAPLAYEPPSENFGEWLKTRGRAPRNLDFSGFK
jgi:hypothetical protein